MRTTKSKKYCKATAGSLERILLLHRLLFACSSAQAVVWRYIGHCICDISTCESVLCAVWSDPRHHLNTDHQLRVFLNAKLHCRGLATTSADNAFRQAESILLCLVDVYNLQEHVFFYSSTFGPARETDNRQDNDRENGRKRKEKEKETILAICIATKTLTLYAVSALPLRYSVDGRIVADIERAKYMVYIVHGASTTPTSNN